MKRCPNGATTNLPNGTKVSTSKITVKDRAKIVRFSLLIHYTECAYHESAIISIFISIHFHISMNFFYL